MVPAPQHQSHCCCQPGEDVIPCLPTSFRLTFSKTQLKVGVNSSCPPSSNFFCVLCTQQHTLSRQEHATLRLSKRFLFLHTQHQALDLCATTCTAYYASSQKHCTVKALCNQVAELPHISLTRQPVSAVHGSCEQNLPHGSVKHRHPLGLQVDAHTHALQGSCTLSACWATSGTLRRTMDDDTANCLVQQCLGQLRGSKHQTRGAVEVDTDKLAGRAAALQCHRAACQQHECPAQPRRPRRTPTAHVHERAGAPRQRIAAGRCRLHARL